MKSIQSIPLRHLIPIRHHNIQAIPIIQVQVIPLHRPRLPRRHQPPPHPRRRLECRTHIQRRPQAMISPQIIRLRPCDACRIVRQPDGWRRSEHLRGVHDASHFLGVVDEGKRGEVRWSVWVGARGFFGRCAIVEGFGFWREGKSVAS